MGWWCYSVCFTCWRPRRRLAFVRTRVDCGHQKGRQPLGFGICEYRRISPSTGCRFCNGPVIVNMSKLEFYESDWRQLLTLSVLQNDLSSLRKTLKTLICHSQPHSQQRGMAYNEVSFRRVRVVTQKMPKLILLDLFSSFWNLCCCWDTSSIIAPTVFLYS